MTNFHFHPLAEIFPLMSDDEFQRLVDDIRLNGQREPIWIYQNKIVDGRNRYNACQVLKIEPTTREFTGESKQLISFVVSLNLHRRHLSESQRAMVAAKLANMQRGYNEHPDDESNPQICGLVSQGEASKLLNVSERSVSSAAKVLKKGVSELAEKVETGEISVSQGAKISELPKGKQIRLIKKGREKGQKILTDLKIQSLKQTAKNYKVPCLLCNPDAVANKKSVSAMMQLLAKKHPSFARYFDSVVDELEELDLADGASADKDRIIMAIQAGYQTFSQIQSKTKIEKNRLDYTISLLLDYGEIELSPQGGKPDAARGARKMLYKIVE